MMAWVNLLLLALALPCSEAINNGVGLTPPMGWNTWCTLGRCGRDYCNDKEIMGIADAMAENGMRALGYQYINMDDCWADHRDDQGNIVPDPSRFPNGLEPVIKYVNSKGFKFGVYTDAGQYTCSQGGRLHKIPGSYGHYQQDANTYASWGVEYVKMDWCNTKIDGKQLDPHVIYKEMSEALNKTGKPIFFNSCEWGVDNPWEWMAQYANSWRTGPDHHDDWDSTSWIIEINAEGKGKYAGPGGWNDPDFIMTGGQGCALPVEMRHCPGQTDSEYRTEFSLWCMMAASLLVATDVRNMTDVMKEVLLNKELIRVNQDTLGKGGGRVAYSDDCDEKNACQIWAKQLNDTSVAVALYNSGSKTNRITVNLSKVLGYDQVEMRDLWKHQDMGVFNHTYSIDVESHATNVYQVRQHKE